ncbi:hypothetical protein J2T13_004961 [Paenibacillus sp. DS2015]|uniref:hypothetical protein n=1 Tax=Paenibacillus sp. DS2015 TaxID=3373917 RepID=UPI003D1A68C7
MNGYVYWITNRSIIIVVDDIRVVGETTLEGATSSIAGVDTTVAGIFITDKVFAVGDILPDTLVNRASEFIKKSPEEEADNLRRRLADIEMALAEMFVV